MAEQITLQLSDFVLGQAAQIGFFSKRQVEDVLARWLEISFAEEPVEKLSDEEVLALSYLKFSAQEEDRFNYLLTGNRENELTAAEREELNQFMRYYERGLLRKSQALAEAVKRGLRETPKP
jgi:hypothetical protein